METENCGESSEGRDFEAELEANEFEWEGIRIGKDTNEICQYSIVSDEDLDEGNIYVIFTKIRKVNIYLHPISNENAKISNARDEPLDPTRPIEEDTYYKVNSNSGLYIIVIPLQNKDNTKYKFEYYATETSINDPEEYNLFTNWLHPIL